jgi:carboxyl-terminal processing protease
MMTRMRILFTLIIFMLCACSSAQESSAREEFIQSGIMAIVQRDHYQPLDINDQLSERVFGLFLKRLDYGKRFFLQSDIDSLKTLYFHKIDDQISGQGDRLEFYHAVQKLYQKRMKEVNGFYGAMLDQPFDYKTSENLETDNDKLSWPKNEAELRDAWRKMLKSQALTRYFDSAEDAVKSGETPEYLPGGVMKPEWETKAREGVRKNIDRFLKRQMELKEDDFFAIYINSILNSDDPHTQYMTAQDREDFNIDMSGKLEGIGARLSEEDGYCKVSEIITGGPAWKDGRLKAGDLIIKVAQADGEPEDIVDLPVDDSVSKIRGKKGTEVRLTVKKPNGDITVIPLTRDVVEIEETFAKTAVVANKKNGMKFGYIKLPKFYRDFNDRASRNSTDDVRTALRNLAKQNVDGVVLDLRDNGGGALTDAVDISGLFIESGPVVQVKDRINGRQIQRDYDSTIEYDGPLVVMINDLSASASEITAAALQDYKRAVIVGASAQSFGKGTVQNMPPLEKYLRNNQFGPIGSLKLTIQKFYRINGGSTQFKGVRPDVRLPSQNDFLDIGETDYDYPMPWDSIQAAPYQVFSKKFDPRTLAADSRRRIAKNDAFTTVQQQADKNRQRKNATLIDIGLDSMLALRKDTRKDADQLKSSLPERDYISVKVIDAEVNHGENSEKLRNEWISSIRKDINLDEVSNVLKDLAKQMKSHKE